MCVAYICSKPQAIWDLHSHHRHNLNFSQLLIYMLLGPLICTRIFVYAAPLSPTNLASPSQSSTSITLSWEQAAGDVVDRYVIDFAYLGECNDFFQVVNSRIVNGNVTEFTLQDLQEFSSYAIRVTAVNSGGSNTSEVLTVNTTAAGKQWSLVSNPSMFDTNISYTCI